MSSYKITIDPRRKKFVRLVSDVHHEIERAIEEEMDDRGWSQNEIGRRLGWDKGDLSRRLRGQKNLTLKTVADFAWVLGRDIQFSMSRPTVRTKTNQITFTKVSGPQTAGAATLYLQDDAPHSTAKAVATP